MRDFFYLNPSMMVSLNKQLVGAEIKMLLGIMYCLTSSGESLFINNSSNREIIAEGTGFNKTPERFSAILGSMVKKGVLKREANGVYRLPDGLFYTKEEISEVSSK